MRRATYLFLALICFCNFAKAQSDEAERAVIDAHNAWFEAFDHGDLDAIDRIETDDFVLVNVDRIVGKQQQIQNIRAGFGGGIEMTRVVGVHSFSLIGNAAVVIGVGYSSSQEGGASFLFTEVWVQSNGRWQVRSAHFSPVGTAQ